MREKTRTPPHSEMLQSQMEMVTEAVESMAAFRKCGRLCGFARKVSRLRYAQERKELLDTYTVPPVRAILMLAI